MPIPISKVPGGTELMDPSKVLTEVGIAEGMKVADLGCGARGPFTLQAARMIGAKGMAYAVDILKPSLQSLESIAKMHGIENIKTVWSDLEIYGATKIEEGSLDLALIINVFFQAKKRVEILKEAIRLLKSSGKLLIADWKKTGAPFGPPVEDRVDPEKIKEAAGQLGLELEKEFEAGPYHFGLVFIKK